MPKCVRPGMRSYMHVCGVRACVHVCVPAGARVRACACARACECVGYECSFGVRGCVRFEYVRACIRCSILIETRRLAAR